ncbi:MAG: BON domain-containing protein [Planctomycetota bacterium]
MSTTTKKTRHLKTSSQRNSTGVRDPKLCKLLEKKLHRLSEQKMQIVVKDGFVTLKGYVRTFRQKERIHRIVMGLHGVRALKDLLYVQPVETIADRQIALHIRHALDAHSELPLGTATMHVRNGQVRLNGHVRTAEERFVAAQVAAHCRGVIEVDNQLTVDPLEEISDEATVQAVHRALAYCEDFETDGVTVSCADGNICLRGEVPSLMDRNLAEEIARLQIGVCSVENHLHVTGESASATNSAHKE